jgi:hypothetical protein
MDPAHSVKYYNPCIPTRLAALVPHVWAATAAHVSCKPVPCIGWLCFFFLPLHH